MLVALQKGEPLLEELTRPIILQLMVRALT
jgi:hypothetical protein